MGLFTDWAKSNVPKNPYTRIIARHLDSLGQVKDETLGMSSHGLDAMAPLRAAKDVVVTGILGTAFGVPGELAGQLGGDLALAGNATLESATNPQGAGAKAYREGGVDAYQATLAPQVRAVVGAEGTALSMIPDLALGGGKKTVQRAGAKIPEVAPGALRESLNARTFKELGDKILPIDKAGGAIQDTLGLVDEAGKAVRGPRPKGVPLVGMPPLPEAVRQANMIPEGLTLKEALKQGRLRLSPEVQAAIDAEEAWLARTGELAALRDSGGAIQEALPGMKVKPRGVSAIPFPDELDEVARQRRMIEAGQLSFPGTIKDRGLPIEWAKGVRQQAPEAAQQALPEVAQVAAAPSRPKKIFLLDASGNKVPLPQGYREVSPGYAELIEEAAPDLSLGNLNDRFNASPVALPGEQAASAPNRLNDLLNAAYGDKRRFAAPQLFKRLGARVEGDGSITREGRDITEQVHAFLEARPGMKPKEAEAALAALAEGVKKPPLAGGGIDRAGNLATFMEGAHPLLVNADGTPKRLYHGTAAGDFERFDTAGNAAGAYGSGAYFTELPEQAAGYAGRMEGAGGAFVSADGVRHAAGAPNIKPTHINLKNPLVFDPTNEEHLLNAINTDPRGGGGQRVRAWLERRGHDGVIVPERDFEGNVTGKIQEIVALRPEQIKSATGNVGTYNPLDPRLLHFAPMLSKSAATSLIGAGAGGIAGGIADPDGGVDGMLGGALAGAAVGYGAGRLPVGALKDTLGLMNVEGKRGFTEALQNGAFKFSSLAADWKADKVETIRGLGLDMLSGRVRALMNSVPQATINGSYRSLLDRWRAGGKFVPYDDELEQMATLNGLDPTKYDWSKLLGQGYMAGGAKSEALHPAASAAAGAAYSFANFGVESVPVLGQVFGAARGAARPYTSGAYRAANDLEQYAVRNAAFKQEARALLERAHAAFAGTLRGAGMDPALLSRQDGLYGEAEVARKYGPAAGAAWRNIVNQIYGVAGATPKEQVDGLAGKFVKSTFGDYADPKWAHKALDAVAPFSRYAVGQVRPLAQMARQNPAATLALAHWLQGDQRRAKAEGRPGYQVGTLRVDTQTPVVGRLVRAQLGGGTGEGRINPTQSVLGVSGGQVGATDQFEQADTIYKWAEAVLGTMGFQFNPLIGAGAFVVGGDYGTDRAPGAQSRFGRTEQALPGPRVASGRGLLNQVRGALGNEPDNFDPVDLLAKEIIFQRTGKPASDPSNAAYKEQLLDPNSALMQEAQARYEEGGNAANAVSAVSPITIQTNTAEKVAYRQAKVDQAAAGEKPSGAAKMYTDPKYPQGAIRNGKKVDPRLRDFETRNATLKRMAPATYAKKRYQFILENKIKE